MKTSCTNPWLQGQARIAKPCLRLFCFPYAGSGASLFREFSLYLPAEIEVCPVQLPGRENRLAEPAIARLDELTEILFSVLSPYFQHPYAFFGHSMGALIAFELTHLIQRQKRTSTPIHLFISGHRAPHLPREKLLTHRLPDQEFLEKLRHLHGTPDEVLKHAELLRVLLPLLRADIALCETYTYEHKEPLTCPLAAFGGLQDEEVSPGEISAWSFETSGAFKVRFFPGDHFFLRRNQPGLLAALAQDLSGFLMTS